MQNICGCLFRNACRWKDDILQILATSSAILRCPHLPSQCQHNNEVLYRNASQHYSLKSAKVLQQQQHLTLVQEEHSIYNSMVRDAKLTVAGAGIETVGHNEPCSNDLTMHYSFDFAQQVHSISAWPMVLCIRGIFGV